MLQLKDITVRIAGRLLIDKSDLVIPEGAKAGFVGRNGTGKTTLFKVITGQLASETGSVELPKGWRIGQVEQEAPGTQESLISIVLSADKERTQLLIQAETEEEPNKLADIHARLADIEAHSAPSRAATILAGLGFDEAAQQRPASSFSGGWRMRVALASILFSRPDLLLLDEPTNYLDLEGTVWLETYLARYPGTVIIISHDRDLLNTAVDSIVHLDQKKLSFWRGKYDSFESQLAEKRAVAAKAREKIEAKTKHMQAFVDRFRAKASKARQAQSKLKAIEKLKPPEALIEAGTHPIKFPDPASKAASPIIRLESVTCGYSANEPILNALNLNIDADDRIALLGSNGNGKSTFAKLLSDRLEHVSGTVTLAPKLKVAMFAQHQMDDLHAKESAVDHVRRQFPDEPEAKVRGRTARMGLDAERMNTAAESLSGGEKARLLLGLATVDGPDLLILDEPTNHLDVGAREALVHGLNEYQGAVILISHDRHLIDATMERLWIVRDGGVSAYDGDLESYRKEVLSAGKTDKKTIEPQQPKKSKQELRKEAAEKRAALAPLKKSISEKEKQIQKLESEISDLDSKLAAPGLFENDPAKGTALSKKKSDAEKLLAETEESWLELTSEYEEAISET